LARLAAKGAVREASARENDAVRGPLIAIQSAEFTAGPDRRWWPQPSGDCRRWPIAAPGRLGHFAFDDGMPETPFSPRPRASAYETVLTNLADMAHVSRDESHARRGLQPALARQPRCRLPGRDWCRDSRARKTPPRRSGREPTSGSTECGIPCEKCWLTTARAKDFHRTLPTNEATRASTAVTPNAAKNPAPDYIPTPPRPHRTRPSSLWALVLGIKQVLLGVGWPGGVAPPGSLRTGRDSLPSPGSCHLDRQRMCGPGPVGEESGLVHNGTVPRS